MTPQKKTRFSYRELIFAKKKYYHSIGIISNQNLPSHLSASPPVKIAMIDGEIDTKHECFTAAIIDQAYPNNEWQHSPDASSHATFLASMLVGAGDQVLGLCPNAHILSFPVIDKPFVLGQRSNSAIDQLISERIVEAYRQKSEVILLSLYFNHEAGYDFSRIRNAIAFVSSKGIRTVISTGNDKRQGAHPVLRTRGVLPVCMAPDEYIKLGFGYIDPGISKVGLAVPGLNIPGAYPGNTYTLESGTSFSACTVSGIYVRLRMRHPQKTSGEVWSALTDVRAINQARKTSLAFLPPLLDVNASEKIIELYNQEPYNNEKEIFPSIY